MANYFRLRNRRRFPFVAEIDVSGEYQEYYQLPKFCAHGRTLNTFFGGLLRDEVAINSGVWKCACITILACPTVATDPLNCVGRRDEISKIFPGTPKAAKIELNAAVADISITLAKTGWEGNPYVIAVSLGSEFR